MTVPETVAGVDADLFAFGVLALVFGGLAAIELAMPHRRARLPKGQRWFTNLSLFALDTVLVRLAIPLLMIGTAQLAGERGWGLFNWIAVPVWLEFLAAVVLLDLALYIQHWATHRVPVLWQLHKVHHSDPDFDVTTAARFHPFEIGASMLYKMAVVALLGAPVLAVFAFEILFNAATVFTHANVGLPRRVDSAARTLFVTPDMHRIHHSARRTETDSNYGTLLSLWDRLFGTYRREAEAGRGDIVIGLETYQDERPGRLFWSLLLPFRK